MAEVNNSGGLPVGGGVAVAIAMVAGYFVVSPPNLDGSRPQGLTGKYIENIQTGEDTRARLWQDPFAAVLAHQNEDADVASLVSLRPKLKREEKPAKHSLSRLLGEVMSIENAQLEEKSPYIAVKIQQIKKILTVITNLGEEQRKQLQASINKYFHDRELLKSDLENTTAKLKQLDKDISNAKKFINIKTMGVNKSRKQLKAVNENYTEIKTKLDMVKKIFDTSSREYSVILNKMEKIRDTLAKSKVAVYKQRVEIDKLISQDLLERQQQDQGITEAEKDQAKKNQHTLNSKIETAQKILIDLEHQLKSDKDVYKKAISDAGVGEKKRKQLEMAKTKKNSLELKLQQIGLKKYMAEKNLLLAKNDNGSAEKAKQSLQKYLIEAKESAKKYRQSIAGYTDQFEAKAEKRDAIKQFITDAKNDLQRLEQNDPFVIANVIHGKYEGLIRVGDALNENEQEKIYVGDDDTMLQNKLNHILEAWANDSQQGDKVNGDSQSIFSIMLAMVPGGPYAEDSEFRLRRRYAILSGLASSGYQPKDPKHIGYIQSAGHDYLEGYALPKIIPYEWYQSREEKSKKPILLMWLDNSFFDQEAIKKLQAIVDVISQGIKAKLWRQNKSGIISKVSVIGPASSDTLLAMEEELRSNTLLNSEEKTKPYKSMTDFSIYSPSASISTLNVGAFIRRLKNKNISFVRTILTDRRLTDALTHELSIRVDGFDKQKTDIVLISEWDTSYGRELPKAFAKSMCKEDKKCLDRIHKFSYMRGIDGKIPNKEKTKGDSSKERKTSEKEADYAAHVELPVGKSQVDYLRRMAGEVDRIDHTLKQKDRKGGIKAIGILGSDVFDKLLIIRVLRDRFPKAIFFTTDLDANLLHPDNLKWTRNLIIASSYSLTLKGIDKLQSGEKKLIASIPPFRSVYQTSAYFSVLLALNEHIHIQNIGKWIEKNQARIFEVGRNGAVDLGPLRAIEADSNRDEAGNGSVFTLIYRAFLVLTLLVFSVWYNRWRLLNARYGKKSDKSFANHFYEVMTSPHTHAISLTLVLGVAGIFAISYSIILLLGLYLVQVILVYCIAKKVYGDNRILCSRAMNGGESCSITDGQLSCQENQSPSSSCPSYYPVLLKPKALAAYLALVITTAVLAWVIIISDEPFSVVDGVSIWPTEILRWLAACIGIVLLCRGWQASKWNIQQVGDAFGFGQTKAISETEPDNSILQIWRTYVINGTGWKRLWRILPVWVAYFFLCNIIILYDKPFVPYRGWGFPIIDLVSIMIAVWVYTFMIFAIVDAIMLCRNFINQLMRTGAARPVEDLDVRIDIVCKREWNVIKLIARRTAVISRLVYYPIIVALILIASRSSYFDRWSTPPGLALVIGFSVFLVICCAVLLRRKAVQAEGNALAVLDREKEELLGEGHKPTGELIGQIDFYSGRIRDIKSGAFLPITEQPWVQAISLLLGGGGTLILFDVLSLAK